MQRSAYVGFAFFLWWPVTASAVPDIATVPPTSIPSSCRGLPAMKRYESLKELPELSAEFKRLNLRIADRGEPFTIDDVSGDSLPPQRQFIRAYRYENKLLVWYFRGGFATSNLVAAFAWRKDDNDPQIVLRATGQLLAGPFCAVTEAMLNGVESRGDRF